jgi:hypothetical protein
VENANLTHQSTSARPGRSIHSCSLPCVKTHKFRTRCTDKRNQTQFVPISKFNDKISYYLVLTFQTLCYVMPLDRENLHVAPTLWIEGMSSVVSH